MKHFLLFSLSAATVLLSNPVVFDRRAVAQMSGVPACSPDLAVPRIPNKKFWVERTSAFYKNETIELQFDAPNAPCLGVVDPAGHFFYLVYPKEQAAGGLKPVVESADFAQIASLKIPTASFRADPYTYGISKNQPVFTRSGKYVFILGENLHVDDPGELQQVVVEYIHQNRPVAAVAVN